MVPVPEARPRPQQSNPRFVRKVLFNHERTQRKLSTCSLRANQACSLSCETVAEARKTVQGWHDAQESFKQTV